MSPLVRIACSVGQGRARFSRIRAFLMMALLGSLIFTACSSVGAGPAGETTCSEYIALEKSFEEQLYNKNKEQNEIIERTLSNRGLDANYAGNLYVAQMQIDEFCGTRNYQNPMNADKPIDDAIR